MSTTTTSIEAPLELDYRAGDGLEVWLLWAAADDRLFVLVNDARMDESFEVDVDHAEALDAFRHPYAYTAFRRTRYVTVSAAQTTTSVS
jgi:hypothetical protein